MLKYPVAHWELPPSRAVALTVVIFQHQSAMLLSVARGEQVVNDCVGQQGVGVYAVLCGCFVVCAHTFSPFIFLSETHH